jgi:hypothetical protein
VRLDHPYDFGHVLELLRVDRSHLMFVSGVLVVLFWVLLLWTSDRVYQLWAVGATVLVAATLFGLMSLPLTTPQRLCDWEPIEESPRRGVVHRDRTVSDGQLSVQGSRFRHGLGMSGPSSATFHLNRAFRTFETSFAIDDAAKSRPHVRFRILVDAVPRYESRELFGATVPQHVSVPVDGANLLTLEVVDARNAGDDHIHADWLEPMLLR